jgi:hypothetical protein
MNDRTVKLFANQIIDGLKEFRRFIVRKSDGTAAIKAGDGFDEVEIDGISIKTKLEELEARIVALEP